MQQQKKFEDFTKGNNEFCRTRNGKSFSRKALHRQPQTIRLHLLPQVIEPVFADTSSMYDEEAGVGCALHVRNINGPMFYALAILVDMLGRTCSHFSEN
jgi:hypothetical protein